jgi:hypothetical protein
MDLHVFTHRKIDYVIAETKQEAWSFLPYTPDIGEAEDMWKCDDDEKLSIWIDPNDHLVAEHYSGQLVEGTMKEWINEFGKGYLCTMEA